MCKSLTNYFPRNNDFLVTYFGKTQNQDDFNNRRNHDEQYNKFNRDVAEIPKRIE